MYLMKHIVSLLVVFFSFTLSGQAGLDDLISPSPEASLIHRFDEQPVSHFTGVPEISIPIYTIQTDGFTIPIALRYHASGIKIADESGSFGLGWAMTAGGRISRTVNDKPDRKYPYTAKTELELAQMSEYDYYQYMYPHSRYNFEDHQRDMFSYNTPTTSGKFILKEDTLVTVPYEPIDVYWSKNHVSGGEYFNVLDDKGNFFRYGKSLDPNSISMNAEISNGVAEGISSSAITSWLMTEAVSSTKRDTVHFKYYYGHIERYRNRNAYKIIHNYYHHSSGNYDHTAQSEPSNFNSHYDRHSLAEIKYKDLKIEFILVSGMHRVKTIKIWSISKNEVQKTINLSYNDYSGSERYTLKKIEFLDKGNTETYEYSFTYNNQHEPFPPFNSKDFDHWGYYNAKNNTTTSIKKDNIYIIGNNVGTGFYLDVPGANKDANETAMQHSILTDMNLPTGGRIHYNYEAHRSINLIGGGLRVKDITYYNLVNDLTPVKTKRYKYGYSNFEEGYGYAYVDPSAEHYITKAADMWPYIDSSGHVYNGISNWNRIITIGSNPTINYFPYGSAIVYPKVTEYTEDTSGNTMGKMNYTFSVDDSSIPDHDPINLRIRNDYAVNNTDETLNHSYFESEIRDKGLNGKLLKQESYKTNFNDTYTLIKKDSLSYTKLKESSHTHLLRQSYVVSDHYKSIVPNSLLFSEIAQVAFGYTDYHLLVENLYSYNNQYIVTGATKLKSRVTQQYDLLGNATVDNTITYEYDNLDHLFPTQIKTKDSRDRDIKTVNYYVQDRPNGTQTATTTFNNLETANKLNYVIKQEQFVDNMSNAISGFISNYGSDLNPSSTYNLEGNSFEPKLHFVDYDNANNLIQYKLENGSEVSLIWGHKNKYPLVKAENATYAEIVATLTTQELNNLKSGNYNQATMIITLNKVRTGLPNAMVTTYTYDPLLGITSMTDRKGYTIYYEYDDFNRLKEVKDSDGNLVTDYQYHYKGQ